MKKHLDNIKMNRREVIKGLAALGAITILPSSLSFLFKEFSSIHFIGFGSAGSNFIEYLQSKGVKGKFTCVTDRERPNLSPETQFIKFVSPGESYFKNGKEIYRDSDMNQKIEIPTNVMNIFEGNDKFVLLSGLGGYTGTYMTETLTILLHENNKHFLTISSVPFDFEGPKRKLYSDKVLKRLQNISNFKSCELEDIRLQYGNLTIKEVFKKADERIYEIYKAIV